MIKKIIKQINESKLKSIIAMMAISASTAATLTLFFTKNVNEISRQKLELMFQEQKLVIIKNCNIDITNLKNRCSMLENKLDFLNSYIEFMKIDKTKPNYDKAVKIRDQYFERSKNYGRHN